MYANMKFKTTTVHISVPFNCFQNVAVLQNLVGSFGVAFGGGFRNNMLLYFIIILLSFLDNNYSVGDVSFNMTACRRVSPRLCSPVCSDY